MKARFVALLSACVALCGATSVRAELDPALRTKIDAEIGAVKALAADPVIVAAVKAYNAAPPSDAQTMTQEKWKSLTLLDPYVRSFAKNPAGEALKAKKSGFVTEAFLSGADGCKVAFIAKPTNWNHKGKAKHDQPMAGHVWEGEVEVDESTGLQQVQVAVPVLDGTTPIGSLVVGLSVTKLRN